MIHELTTLCCENSQKLVAEGIKGVRDAVNQMPAAITTPDSTLSSQIATAQTNVQSLQAGGQDVLTAAVCPPSLFFCGPES